MNDLLAGIEQLTLARALKASFIAYPVVNALHILSIGALLTSVILIDLRIIGAFRSTPQDALLAILRPTALTAFTGAVLTGCLLFSVRANEYVAMPVFVAKMGLILLAGANFLAFVLLFGRGRETGGVAAAALAGLSLILWISVLFAGRFIGFM